MSIHCVIIVCMAAVSVLVIVCSTGCGPATPPKVLWHEAEAFVSAPKTAEQTVGDKAPASGGKVLYGGTLDIKDSVVTYKLDVPRDMPGAKIIFRYARLHWRKTMKPAPVKVTLAGPASAEQTVKFANTGGWGRQPSEYDLLSADLGDLTTGAYKLTLTSLADDGSVTIDGFFIAPGDFEISTDELDSLVRVTISSRGYVGLQRASTVVRQDVEKTLTVAARSFDDDRPVGNLAAHVFHGPVFLMKDIPGPTTVATVRGLVQSDVSDLDDGQCTLGVRCERLGATLSVKLILAGQLIGSLDSSIKLFEAAAAKLKATGAPDAERYLPDMEHGAAYLKASRARLLSATESKDDARKQGLAEAEGYISDPQALVDNMRRVISQVQETAKRLAVGKDPYEGRAGDMRRAFRSKASGQVEPYRVFVPSLYAKADKVPFIFMLHGGGGDEDYFADMADGAILSELENRGYLAVMPKWHSRLKPAGDMGQLLEIIRKEYPKIDPNRMYCTGISMGGYGTYKLATSNPDLFAAICCVSGTGDPALAGKLKNTPTLILQGGADTVVPPARAKKVAAKMKKLGQSVELKIFPRQGHGYKLPDYLKLTLDFFDKHARNRSSR